MPEPLPNPERFWKSNPGTRAVTSAEIERRLGKPAGAWSSLSGGLANANVLVDGRVLRIYQRDSHALRVEAELLRRPWASFRVPALLATGEDFALLEYVPHGPLLGSAEHGVAVGRALAEIHGIAFEKAGFLTPELEIEKPFSDLVPSLIDYARSLMPRAEAPLGSGLSQKLLETLESNASALRAVVGQPVLLHADFKASNLHWTHDDRLLILDWEFAYAGSRLSDIGQLLRWAPPGPFVRAFASAYVEAGGVLPADFQRWAGLLDLVNLIGLVADRTDIAAEPRVRDVSERIALTLALCAD
ncbi:MAG: aminoglycoside phosphotransferase family protein [Polyangiaceae bacterium]